MLLVLFATTLSKAEHGRSVSPMPPCHVRVMMLHAGLPVDRVAILLVVDVH